uniref:Uncharacterized protein n=1 Tax=Hyalomma excavatum TaxID=257692 RepID=A0A131XQD1_9ACAR
MKHTTTVQEFLLLVFVKTGMLVRPNLTVEAQRYISALGKDIESWGLTADYEYWTNRTLPYDRYPITARVNSLWCGNEQTYDPMGKILSLRMTFRIADGIDSPFTAVFNATLPLIKLAGIQSKVYQIEFNNATRIDIRVKNPERSRKKVKGYITKCKFQARVDYAGYFAYKDRSGYHTVGVGNLQSLEKHLEMLADFYLEYFIQGTYEQRILVAVD